jgi:hypothetical protein
MWSEVVKVVSMMLESCGVSSPVVYNVRPIMTEEYATYITSVQMYPHTYTAMFTHQTHNTAYSFGY